MVVREAGITCDCALESLPRVLTFMLFAEWTRSDFESGPTGAHVLRSGITYSECHDASSARKNPLRISPFFCSARKPFHCPMATRGDRLEKSGDTCRRIR